MLIHRQYPMLDADVDYPTLLGALVTMNSNMHSLASFCLSLAKLELLAQF